VQISSAAGFKASPGLGLYNASKFALEGMSEALALEVKIFGIRVTIVEPGPFRTKFADSSLDRAHTRIPEYRETAGLTENRILSYNGKQDGDPVKGALAMIAAVNSENPPLRLPLGKFTLDAIRMKIESVQKDVAAWEKTALSTDDPVQGRG
jgi:short-subunit dehydrogenase